MANCTIMKNCQKVFDVDDLEDGRVLTHNCGGDIWCRDGHAGLQGFCAILRHWLYCEQIRRLGPIMSLCCVFAELIVLLLVELPGWHRHVWRKLWEASGHNCKLCRRTAPAQPPLLWPLSCPSLARNCMDIFFEHHSPHFRFLGTLTLGHFTCVHLSYFIKSMGVDFSGSYCKGGGVGILRILWTMYFKPYFY